MKKLSIFIFVIIFPVLSSASGFSIINWNIGDSDRSLPKFQELKSVIDDSGGAPDILILQEVFKKRFDKFKKEMDYKYSIHSTQLDNKINNIGILTNFKIIESDLLLFREKNSGALLCRIQLKNEVFNIISVHFDYIKSKKRGDNGYVEFSLKKLSKTLIKEVFKSNPRKTEAIELLEWCGKPGKKTIIAGDFNTISLSSSIRKIKKHYKDSLSGIKNLFLFKGTYKKIKFPLKPRIDFIFYSRDIKLKSSEIISYTPGDHYPVKALFFK